MRDFPNYRGYSSNHFSLLMKILNTCAGNTPVIWSCAFIGKPLAGPTLSPPQAIASTETCSKNKNKTKVRLIKHLLKNENDHQDTKICWKCKQSIADLASNSGTCESNIQSCAQKNRVVYLCEYLKQHGHQTCLL